MSDEVVNVPVTLEIVSGGNAVLKFGPLPPDELLKAVAQLETLEGQNSFLNQLLERLKGGAK